jgi:O-antigen/teichoic acid export membrane protein
MSELDSASAAQAPATPETQATTGAFRFQVLTASFWTLFEMGASSAIRLGSNLILTRLLFPEAFGLMALVAAFTQGLEMFTDLGLGASVVQRAKKADRDFLDTIWTLQLVRGMGMTLVSLCLALPLERFYGQPELLLLFCIAAFQPFIRSFTSTSLFVLHRELALGKLAVLNLATQVIGTTASISLAAIYREVWTLPAGALIGLAAQAVASHFMQPHGRDRLRWSPSAYREIYTFGRWIFVATVFTFISTRADKLILGRALEMSALGFYSIASSLALMVVDVQGRLSRRVLFPVYARLRNESALALRPRVARVRLALLSLALPPLWAMAVFGDPLLRLLYDDRYLGAGWMLQVLAIGCVIRVIPVIGPIDLAQGNSPLHMVLRGVEAVGLIGCMALGGWLAGGEGMITGVAVSQLLVYAVTVVPAWRYGVWLWTYDLAAATASAAVIGLGTWLR